MSVGIQCVGNEECKEGFYRNFILFKVVDSVRGSTVITIFLGLP
jgi:hypothetical protein